MIVHNRSSFKINYNDFNLGLSGTYKFDLASKVRRQRGVEHQITSTRREHQFVPLAIAQLHRIAVDHLLFAHCDVLRHGEKSRCAPKGEVAGKCEEDYQFKVYIFHVRFAYD